MKVPTPGISVSVIMIIGVSPTKRIGTTIGICALDAATLHAGVEAPEVVSDLLDAADVVAIGARSAAAIGAACFASKHGERPDQADIAHAFGELPSTSVSEAVSNAAPTRTKPTIHPPRTRARANDNGNESKCAPNQSHDTPTPPLLPPRA